MSESDREIRDRIRASAKVTSLKVKRMDQSGSVELEYEVSLEGGMTLDEARLAAVLAQVEVEIGVLTHARASGLISDQHYHDQVRSARNNYGALAMAHVASIRGTTDE